MTEHRWGRCRALTRAGTRCRFYAIKGHGLCRRHTLVAGSERGVRLIDGSVEKGWV